MTITRDKIIIHERSRELSKAFWKDWNQCSRKAVLSEREWRRGVEGAFVANASESAGIGILVHSFNEYALTFGVNALRGFLQDPVVEHATLDIEDYPEWLVPTSQAFAKAVAIARWFWSSFDPSDFGEVLTFEAPLALCVGDIKDKTHREGVRAAVEAVGVQNFPWTMYSRNEQEPVEREPSELMDNPPVIIRHPDIIIRLTETQAENLTEAAAAAWHKKRGEDEPSGSHIFHAGLHVFDWKTTGNVANLASYVDIFDQATYRELARVNFAKSDEHVYFHYFGIPFGTGQTPNPSVFIRSAGRETVPGSDQEQIVAAVLHAAHQRRYALTVDPDGVPDNGHACYDKYNKPCRHMSTSCNNMLSDVGLVRLARSLVVDGDDSESIVKAPAGIGRVL
jgi:hypothetical protein